MKALSVCFAIIGLYCLWLALENPPTAPTSGAPKAASQSPVTVGDEVIVSDGISTNVLAGVDKDAYDAIVKASVAHDKVGFDELVSQLRAILIPCGTRAKVIDLNGSGTVELRLESGARSGLAVWTAYEYAKKTAP